MNEFTPEQKEKYKDFTEDQMNEIKNGFENGLSEEQVVYIHKKRTVKKRRGNDIKRRVVEMCIIFTTRFLCIVDNKKYTNRKRWV